MKKSTILLDIRNAFEQALQEKNSWKKNDVYKLYLQVQAEVLSKTLDNSTAK
jgi:hypothetical protein